jgi:hypothetical protein
MAIQWKTLLQPEFYREVDIQIEDFTGYPWVFSPPSGVGSPTPVWSLDAFGRLFIFDEKNAYFQRYSRQLDTWLICSRERFEQRLNDKTKSMEVCIRGGLWDSVYDWLSDDDTKSEALNSAIQRILVPRWRISSVIMSKEVNSDDRRS